MVIKRVGVWSVARIYGALSAAMGLIFGCGVALFSMIGGGMAAANGDGPGWFAPVFGAGAIVVLPIFYGVMGVIMGAISAALYNLFAGMVGGISVDVSQA
jgi:hypothetical protein